MNTNFDVKIKKVFCKKYIGRIAYWYGFIYCKKNDLNKIIKYLEVVIKQSYESEGRDKHINKILEFNAIIYTNDNDCFIDLVFLNKIQFARVYRRIRYRLENNICKYGGILISGKKQELLKSGKYTVEEMKKILL